jgi:hypothetical protein
MSIWRHFSDAQNDTRKLPLREPVARFGPQDALWDGIRSDHSKSVRLSASESPIPRKSPEAEYARGLEAELVGFE